MSATVVLGSQWGDEGKGKLVDILAAESQLCLRCQGGHNAGHTIKVNGITHDFHILPSGLVNPKCRNLIGNGCVVHIPQFFHELAQLEKHGIDTAGRIFVSDRCHIILKLHTEADGQEEARREKGSKAGSIGTTKKGIGPTYSMKAARMGVRICDLYDWEVLEEGVRNMEDYYRRLYGDDLKYSVDEELGELKDLATKLKPYVVQEVLLIKEAMKNHEKILVEGANAIMLDVDHGTYPYTSSNTGVGGINSGTGLDARAIKNVCGVVKAYTTRVGAGPFPSEQLNDTGNQLQEIGKEFGVTTGRRRRCGWLDLFLVKYSHDVNHYDSIMLTKLDVLDTFQSIKVATGYTYNGTPLQTFPSSLKQLANAEVQYETLPGWNQETTGISKFEELPENARKYVEYIEKFVGVPIKYIGTGPGREQTIVR